MPGDAGPPDADVRARIRMHVLVERCGDELAGRRAAALRVERTAPDPRLEAVPFGRERIRCVVVLAGHAQRRPRRLCRTSVFVVLRLLLRVVVVDGDHRAAATLLRRR